MSDDLSNFSLIELFKLEAEGQIALLTRHLLALEQGPAGPEVLEAMMRAAHSLKGAARIVGLTPAVQVAHVMEDCFVAAQQDRARLGRAEVDALLQGVDWLAQLSRLNEADVESWTTAHADQLDAYVRELAGSKTPVVNAAPPVPVAAHDVPKAATVEPEPMDRVLRVTAEKLNRLLGLAGESLVESRRLQPFNRSLLRLKRVQQELGRSIDRLREVLGDEAGERVGGYLREVQSRAAESRELLQVRMEEMDRFDRAATQLSGRLYREAQAVRMRPFADGVAAFPRMVRDLSHQLGKDARLTIAGEQTQVDRDVLEKIEAPLTHLLRNAVDHGLETAETRINTGKSACGELRLEARHRAGMLIVTVSDDGRGVDIEAVRAAVVRKKLTTAEVASKLSAQEVLDFLFLPGFSLKTEVTEISGRGVGLDVVQSMLKALRGTVRIHTQSGHGTTFELHLPVTLSVVRALLVEIAGEPYALPLASVARVLRVERAQIETAEGRPHFAFDGGRAALVSAREVLELDEAGAGGDSWCVVVLGDKGARHGLVVDKFLGERELVVQPLDPRLGKVEDIAAAAVLEDGAPALILDVQDLRRSMGRLTSEGAAGRWSRAKAASADVRRQRVLVVDDSLTVRELERKLLVSRGYDVTVAVDGMEGWNAARTGDFDLVITDVDMPRLDGIELVKLMKADDRLRTRPVMIVSYKDREEDRRRGLDAGADYYLTKGSFHDESLLDAVVDLIGPVGEAGA
ncbi:hybrid sensor histidine kinase/response regulator [Rariglobus hedericola]|uniref:histidine kinase n=1 Tax=Rariglobus hedericola TaxID=2597822 RepID=A0A556QJL8_9BACT|nr:hybrid sensor histidine kinase/response regulator [Rariglobus hedericola]TSJ76844.1 hybrid sensor histidine kinase/response regulator [Rariglobus hedericola]